MVIKQAATVETIKMATNYSMGDLLQKMIAKQGMANQIILIIGGKLVSAGLCGIEREDGSGKCFIITARLSNGLTTKVFHRCS